jgi:hypothetical protein
MFWDGLTPHLLPGARPSFTKWPLSQFLPILTQDLRGGDAISISPSQVSVECLSLFCWRQTQTRAEVAAAQKWVAQNEWRKTCMGPILILLLGTAIGLYSCGTRLWFVQVFSRNTLAQYQNLNITNTKKTRSLAREQPRPTNQKEEFLTLVCANLTSFKFSLVFLYLCTFFESPVCCLQIKFCRVLIKKRGTNFTATQNPATTKSVGSKEREFLILLSLQRWSGAF